MARLGRHRFSTDVATPQDGAGTSEAGAAERYCALCGQQTSTSGPAIERFGEPFCSEAHAEDFVKAVRTARVQITAATPETTEIARAESSAEAAPKPQSWKGPLKMAICCGAPMLALVVLAGGGGALLGAAGGLLPVLAALACPLAMLFMMRGMFKTGDKEKAGDKGGEK